jgi:hypothetical protein
MLARYPRLDREPLGIDQDINRCTLPSSSQTPRPLGGFLVLLVGPYNFPTSYNQSPGLS